MDRMLLEATIAGLRAELEDIERQIAQVTGLMGRRRPGRPRNSSNAAAIRPKGRKRRELSAEARARIAEGQRKRWAAYRKAAK